MTMSVEHQRLAGLLKLCHLYAEDYSIVDIKSSGIYVEVNDLMLVARTIDNHWVCEIRESKEDDEPEQYDQPGIYDAMGWMVATYHRLYDEHINGEAVK